MHPLVTSQMLAIAAIYLMGLSDISYCVAMLVLALISTLACDWKPLG